MPPSDNSARLEAIRHAMNLAIKKNGLRATAREVGLSAMGLSNFAKGERRPNPTTRQKVTLWAAGHGAAYGAPVEAARAALGLLLDLVPQNSRERAHTLVLAALEQAHAESRTRTPAWITALKDGDAEG